MNQRQKRERELVLKTLSDSAKQFTGEDAVNDFIKTVLTDGERINVGRRITVARMVLTGETFFEIHSKLHISPNTFRNIRRWIHKELPEYNKVLEQNRDREEEKVAKQQSRSHERVEPFSFADLKRRYPMHFLLFNMSDEFMSRRGSRKRSVKKLK